MAGIGASAEVPEVVTLLGGRKVFRGKIADSGDLQEAVRAGLPYAAFDSLRDVLAMSAAELAALVGVASRTLARRKSARRLSPIESDRLYRIAHAALMAGETLGSLEKARAWLQRPNRALGGATPLSALDTEIGERQVEELLDRINHGIYS